MRGLRPNLPNLSLIQLSLVPAAVQLGRGGRTSSFSCQAPTLLPPTTCPIRTWRSALRTGASVALCLIRLFASPQFFFSGLPLATARARVPVLYTTTCGEYPRRTGVARPTLLRRRSLKKKKRISLAGDRQIHQLLSRLDLSFFLRQMRKQRRSDTRYVVRCGFAEPCLGMNIDPSLGPFR